MQEIVDLNNLALWYSMKFRGSDHDSKAFKRRALCNLIVEKAHLMMDLRLFLIGDSTHAIQPFLLAPCINTKYGTNYDIFNYHLSACRFFLSARSAKSMLDLEYFGRL